MNMVYVAARAADYKKLRKEIAECGGLAAVIDEETLGEHLDGMGGYQYIDEIQDVDEFDDGYGWIRKDTEHLKLDDSKGDFRIKFPSTQAQQTWFFPAFTVYVKTLSELLNKATLANFAQYELLSPDYLIKQRYMLQWEGFVAVLDGRGNIHEMDTPMEFLRCIRPGETWVIGREGWRYKP